jgi:cation transport regulator ChaC
MTALDRGGQCRGVLYRLPAADLEGQLGKLVNSASFDQLPHPVQIKFGGYVLKAQV